jgi:hypothetical protein
LLETDALLRAKDKLSDFTEALRLGNLTAKYL